ncbi:histone H1.8-like [Saccoglossus kowalevskii]|uniref:Sperm-specific protein PHI-2B/PHI-3-like n=1 Tax=Saccoglossus kowalevskii TaxID=10224 RepID=A0ABM0MJB8_SACKO|nr:PREDICTED: sperm-specific protein PHI-2B/PHI-3-like [Saccoglossus kowalevskii]
MVDSASSKPVKTTKAVASHPKTMDMVVEALTTLKDRKGISIQAIKAYILTHYTTVSPTHLTSSLRRALKTGLASGMLVRPKDSHANGVSGRLRLGKLPQKPRKSVNKTTPKKKAVKKTPKKDKKPNDKVKTKKPKSATSKKIKKAEKSPKPKAKKAITKKTPKKTAKPKKPVAKKVTKK